MYVYELIQNAVDAGATRVSWKTEPTAVQFQHNGAELLTEANVRGLSSIGSSTKGVASIGFMGIGFKSVFQKYLSAQVTDAQWKFRFDVSVKTGNIGQKFPNWDDTTLPLWDEAPPQIDDGYTTSFRLSNPRSNTTTFADDIRQLISEQDPTPLAVLAREGLREIRVDETTWTLEAQEDGVSITRNSANNAPVTLRLKTFVARYRPNDDAMRRLLEVRREMNGRRDHQGSWPEREVVAIIVLDGDGRPTLLENGRAYATLPTQDIVPFGFHLHADWLVDLDRQGLRDVVGDPWQESIVAQVPELVLQILQWLKREAVDTRRAGYHVLRKPTESETLDLTKAIARLKAPLQDLLSQRTIVPVLGDKEFSSPSQLQCLPEPFHKDLSRKPMWNVELIFGTDILDENVLGPRGTAFAQWLSWGQEIEPSAVDWQSAMPSWWEKLPESEANVALLALWSAIATCRWSEAPVVPTEAGGWVSVSSIKWLNERPPDESEPSGPAVCAALKDLLPGPTEVVSPEIRRFIEAQPRRTSWNRHIHSDAIDWFHSNAQKVKLADVVREGCEAAVNAAFIIEATEWAISRGQRTDLIPYVLTEAGRAKPSEAILADPLVEDGACRRDMFPNFLPISGDYRLIDDIDATKEFLTHLGVMGRGHLREERTKIGRFEKQKLAEILGVELAKVRDHDSNNDGYTVIDYALPFWGTPFKAAALQTWLFQEHNCLYRKGRKRAQYKFSKNKEIHGTAKASWLSQLRELSWVHCADGKMARPSEVLLSENPDYEDAPVAQIPPRLARVLQDEGLSFGDGLSKSPAIRRLEARSGNIVPDHELAQLIDDGLEQVRKGLCTREELILAVKKVRIGNDVPFSRVVLRADGSGRARSDLGGWVVAISSVDHALSDNLKSLPLELPATTTGDHALDYLMFLSREQPGRVDQIRRNVAQAFRYVHEDIQVQPTLRNRWTREKHQIRVIGRGAWWPIDDRVAIDDASSPLVRSLLADERILLPATQFGERREVIRTIAQWLGISFISDKIQTIWGKRISTPDNAQQVRRLLAMLSQRESARPLDLVEFFDDATFIIGDTTRKIHAQIDGMSLRLVGGIADYATEAAGQIVTHFELERRGQVALWISGALNQHDNRAAFDHMLHVLASDLGLEVPPEVTTSTKDNRSSNASLTAQPAESDPDLISTSPTSLTPNIAATHRLSSQGSSKTLEVRSEPRMSQIHRPRAATASNGAKAGVRSFSTLALDQRNRFKQRFRTWWSYPENKDAAISQYERSCWPHHLLPNLKDRLKSNDDEAWFVLLILGVCRSMGRSKDEQHRSFIQLLIDRKWLETFLNASDKEQWMHVLDRWHEGATNSYEYGRWMSLFPYAYIISSHLETYRQLLKKVGLRPSEKYALPVLLTPRVDEALTSTGQAFDAPPAPLGMGIHWVLRELVRLGVTRGEHLEPHCWVPEAMFLDLLEHIGMPRADLDQKDSDVASANIHSFIASEFAKHDCFDMTFDIPFRHLCNDTKLARELGLELS